GSLAAAGPSPVEGLAANAIASVVSLTGGSDQNAPKPTPAGLRMAGEYGTQAALDIEFRPEGAVLGCGAVAAIKPYTVALRRGRSRAPPRPVLPPPRQRHRPATAPPSRSWGGFPPLLPAATPSPARR